MKPKSTTIYARPGGGYSLHAELGTPVPAYLLHTRSQGDWNRVEFKPALARSTRRETREAVLFVPREPLALEDRANLERGRRFFSIRDGFLPGAFMELAKRGEIVRIPT